MSAPLLKLERIGVHCPDGGNVHIIDGVAPHDLRLARYGVGFGPLRLTPFADSTVVLDDLAFASAEDDGWLPFIGSAGAIGALVYHDQTDGKPIDPEDTQPTRRAVLAGIGLSILAVGSARAAEESLYSVASFELVSSERGINLAVDDVVADYLPPEHTFYVSVNDGSVGKFAAGEESLTINPGITGRVDLESDEALSFVSRMWADLRAEDEVVYQFQPVDEPFDSYTVGDEVVISDQPIITDPIDVSEPGDILLSVNDTSVPHADGRDSAVGEWYLRDGRQLVYIVGEDAPDSTLVEITINAGLVDRLRAKYDL